MAFRQRGGKWQKMPVYLDPKTEGQVRATANWWGCSIPEAIRRLLSWDPERVARSLDAADRGAAAPGN